MDYRVKLKLWQCLICVTIFLPLTRALCPMNMTGPEPACNEYNLAFRRSTMQKDEHRTFEKSEYPVDDNATSCSQSTVLQSPWWQVDLGKNMYVRGAVIYFDQEMFNVLQTYTVEVQEDKSESWRMCYAYTGTVYNPQRITCVNAPVLGRMVRLTAYHENINLKLCHVGVYGSCFDGSYGPYCENKCGECDLNYRICDVVTGTCPRGCDDGYSGLTCKENCPFKMYGRKCASRCGECRNNQTCQIYSGLCPGGLCQIAWQPPYCNETCKDGYFGYDCKKCGKCQDNIPCDKLTGECPNKQCAAGSVGYTERNKNCSIECANGTWGIDCSKQCGSCYDNATRVPAPCNKENGVCDAVLGCSPGYIQDPSNFCTNQCPDTTWGKNCPNSCGNCGRRLTEGERENRTDDVTVVPIICNKQDGTCFTGCLPGWQNVHCTDKCDPGTYGKDCSSLCGHCKGDCDYLTALCPGDCDDGYIGSTCTVSCPLGFYGFKCQNKCPINCGSNCTITDGSCVCKDGWMGHQCTEVCPANHYGSNCEFPCGNCIAGSTCLQTTGYCSEGCEPDWTGLQCNDKVIREFYERSYADVIGGVIGGVIALILIGVFAGWVVWRYRNDKSIHVGALASSLRRMSLRGSQNLRRSVQRLSMRMKRGTGRDQQHLGNAAEVPDTTHVQKARHKTPRMYECLKLQSNVIHYDDFTRIHLQLQETRSGGRTLLYDAFESFLSQRPRDQKPKTNGSANDYAGHDNKSYYDAGVDDVQLGFDANKPKIPEFLPLGSNLSGFLLVNSRANSENLWNHLQQRQIETIISIGKEASCSWKPGERMSIGNDVVDCVDVQLYGSHRESKLTVQRRGETGRRAVRHLECFFFNPSESYPLIPTVLMFIDRFQQLHYTQRERSILVNYLNMHDHAILLTLVASCLEILKETKRVDILRTVAIGGNATTKAIKTFDGFKYLHDMVFHYIASTDQATSI